MLDSGKLDPSLSVITLILLLFESIQSSDWPAIKLFCDFESDLCSWRHETQYTHGLKWLFSEPNSCGYGENFCPGSSDRYLYTTSRQLSSNGSFVRIAHYPLSTQVTGKCTLTLKYIAYGVGFAKLVIGIRMVGDREPEPILVVYTSKESEWHQVKVPLVASYVFTPVIEAVRLEPDSDFPADGFIAIDDTSISNGCLIGDETETDFIDDFEPYLPRPLPIKTFLHDELPSVRKSSKVSLGSRTILPVERGNYPRAVAKKPRRPARTRLRPTRARASRPSCGQDDGIDCQPSVSSCSDDRGLCDFKIDCDDASDEYRCPAFCDLDAVHDQEQFKELCGWSQTRAGTRYATWILVSGSHAVKYFEVFPRIDATRGTRDGKYLILNLVEMDQVPPVHLNSPTFFSARSTCYLTFSYVIYDQSAVFYVTLTVESDENSSREGKSLSILWKSNIATVSRSSEWRNASAYIGRQKNPFFVTFSRSSAPYSSYGTVALDNLRFNAC